MTPERLAELKEQSKKKWADVFPDCTFDVAVVDELIAEVERLQAAVIAEREACAKIADDYGTLRLGVITLTDYRLYASETIAKRIRARGTQ